MSLKSGLYTIRCKATDNYIGRSENEDKSLNPKRVINLPEGVEAPKWQVEHVGGGKYILSINDALTAAIDKKVFAILGDEPAPTEWIIESIDYQGENNFV
ncbi:hypothetical protein VNI00_015328 [Paramarasmius palmivorus]|uniref:Uncharacterized protein n=1 Tax=Paramarasmius palmivorus TaxID=297713 RepID=A0AAW0BLG9_9AGAR